ncbi:MAG: hypothetical protein AAGF77_07920 [Bacteroidota bacterium]
MKLSSNRKQAIPTIWVFTQDNRLYTRSVRSGKRFQVPLRWVPVIPEGNTTQDTAN